MSTSSGSTMTTPTAEPPADRPATPETPAVPCRVFLHAVSNVARARTSPDLPALHIPGIYAPALRRAGYAPELLASETPARLLREGWRFGAAVAASPLAVVCQGYGTFAAARALAAPSRRRPNLLLHTWKVPFHGTTHLTARANDHVLRFVLNRSRLVVLASRAQERLINLTYPGVPTLWMPVTADTDWWRPGPLATTVLDRAAVAPD